MKGEDVGWRQEEGCGSTHKSALTVARKKDDGDQGRGLGWLHLNVLKLAL